MALSKTTTARLTLTLAFAVAMLLLAACGDDSSNTCQSTADCETGTACLSNTCQSIGCQTNLDCPGDSICAGEAGASTCTALQCRTNLDCSSEDRRFPFCVGGRCVADAPPECSTRDDCDAGENCVQQACVEVEADGVCDNSNDCGNPQVCDPMQGEAGMCVSACANTADCAELEGLNACEQASGLCVPVECLSVDDCGLDEVCNDNTCEIERFACNELSCDDPSRPFRTEPLDDLCRCVQCLTTNHCSEPSDEVCSAANRCVYCEFTAETADACPVQAPLLSDGCCVQCFSDDACQGLGLGSVCQNGRCVACNCNAGCECPEDSECIIQGDNTGICQRPLGQLGDSCTRQQDCDVTLACSYADGECVELGAGSFCQDGCLAPSRCASVDGGGSICYGCDPQAEVPCPGELECQVPASWEGSFVGGQCFPAAS